MEMSTMTVNYARWRPLIRDVAPPSISLALPANSGELFPNFDDVLSIFHYTSRAREKFIY